MVNTIGLRKTEKLLQTGTTLTPKQAIQIGLIDEIVNENDLMKRAEENVKIWNKIPSRIKFFLR